MRIAVVVLAWLITAAAAPPIGDDLAAVRRFAADAGDRGWRG